jgi:hypothetical protein
MKKFLIAAAAVAAMSSSAMAQTASQDITITASVDGFCAISGAANTTALIPTSTTTGLTTGSPPSPTFNVTCNKGSTVKLTSLNGASTLGNALENAILTSALGFRNKIEYSASVTGPGSTAVVLDTNVVSGPGANVTGAFAVGAASASATTVTITPETSTSPLLAGSYSDTLTVTIAPAS